MKIRLKPIKLKAFFTTGLCLSLLWVCSVTSPSISSFVEAEQYLQEKLLPNISVATELVSDTDAYNAVIPPLVEIIPDPNTYLLAGATPTNDPKTAGVRCIWRWL